MFNCFTPPSWPTTSVHTTLLKVEGLLTQLLFSFQIHLLLAKSQGFLRKESFTWSTVVAVPKKAHAFTLSKKAHCHLLPDVKIEEHDLSYNFSPWKSAAHARIEQGLAWISAQRK